jgi:hypothetical protein
VHFTGIKCSGEYLNIRERTQQEAGKKLNN